MRRRIAAGNWKMNGTAQSLAQINLIADNAKSSQCDIVICPPAPLLFRASEISTKTNVAIGAQDCHTENSGAFTGDIGADMIADTGAKYVIVGHSERREIYQERNRDVRKKAKNAHDSNLCAIICIGESLEDREANNTLDIIAGQLSGSVPDEINRDNTVIAYEPIWAIGTGKIPSLAQIIEVHDFIRKELSDRFGQDIAQSISLLYGGSVKPQNAAQIFQAENVDGALVGGASLKATDFNPIIDALSNS